MFPMFIFSCAYTEILFSVLMISFCLIVFIFRIAIIVCSPYLECSCWLCIIYVISGNRTDLFSLRHEHFLCAVDLLFVNPWFVFNLMLLKVVRLQRQQQKHRFGGFKRISGVSIIILVAETSRISLSLLFFHEFLPQKSNHRHTIFNYENITSKSKGHMRREIVFTACRIQHTHTLRPEYMKIGNRKRRSMC